MATIIPIDLTIVTLRTSNGLMPQRFTEEYASSTLKNASDLLISRIGIGFRETSISTVIEEMPADIRSDVVTEAGYHFLSAIHRASNGARAFFVDSVDRRELGGQSRHQTRICLVAYSTDEGSALTRMLAHELGHLLELPHVDTNTDRGPGRERQMAAKLRNLMYSGALNPLAEMTADQRRIAAASSLATTYGRPG